MKNKLKKRTSNRHYPIRKCKKTDCNQGFIPSDARQIYCCRQHQIDASNDRRRSINSYELVFNKGAKNNKQTLLQIYSSEEYKKKGYVHYSVLQYLNYDFDIFHSIIIDEEYRVEVKFCFEYGLYLINVEKQLFKIVKNDNHEI
jgi:hypothetical protein